MMKKILNIGLGIYEIVMAFFLIQGTYLFLWRSEPLMKHFLLVAIPLWLLIVLLVGVILYNTYSRYTKTRKYRLSLWYKVIINIAILIINGIFLYAFLYSALFDYFQPFSVYDPAIYAILYAIVLLLVKAIIDIFRTFICKEQTDFFFVPHIIFLLMFLVVFTWGQTQTHYEYQNGTNVEHVFKHGDNDYQSYRIPSILVIPEGSLLASGETLSEDMIVVFSEARKNSSDDNGNVDLAVRYSKDAGVTWSDIEYVVDLGDNKIGNLTPVFDRETGIIQMIHLRKFYDNSSPSGAYIMTSNDGGVSWGGASLLYEGKGIGPGHGIQIDGGMYDGRLLVPGYSNEGFVYYSDDNGTTWDISGTASLGNETEIAQIDENTLIMTTRVNIGMALPHGEIYKHFSYSYDGGTTWSEAIPNEDVLTPICMSGLATFNGTVYYSGPQEFYARANIKILQSVDGGVSFTEVASIYEGAAGYSDLGVLSDGRLVLLFENGAVEYDERMTFIIVDPE